MRQITAITLVVFYALLIGCADSQQLVRLNGDASTKLNPSGGVYIAIPKDGVYENKDYRGSGMKTATLIQSAFAQKVTKVEVGKGYEQLNEAQKSAKQNGFEYLVFPTILHWEDRATEWSGVPDKVELKIEIIDVGTSKVITASIVKGTSGLATFGGDHPQNLLQGPVTELVTSLY